MAACPTILIMIPNCGLLRINIAPPYGFEINHSVP